MNYNEEKVKEEIKNRYFRTVKKYGEYHVIGVFYFGSGNYNMDTPSSDIDVKIIVLPTFDNIVDSKDWVNKLIIEEDGSHSEIKDIRLMFDSYKKQNINFLETLFTKYRYIDRNYISVWEGCIEKNREKIARYNPRKSILSMYGNMKTKYKSMLHRAPHNEEDVDKYGYGLKDFHHIARLYDFINRYIDGTESYEQILIPKHKELLISYKTTALPLEEAKILVETMITKTEERVNEKVEEWKDLPVDKEVEELFTRVQRMLIKESLMADLGYSSK